MQSRKQRSIWAQYVRPGNNRLYAAGMLMEYTSSVMTFFTFPAASLYIQTQRRRLHVVESRHPRKFLFLEGGSKDLYRVLVSPQLLLTRADKCHFRYTPRYTNSHASEGFTSTEINIEMGTRDSLINSWQDPKSSFAERNLHLCVCISTWLAFCLYELRRALLMVMLMSTSAGKCLYSATTTTTTGKKKSGQIVQFGHCCESACCLHLCKLWMAWYLHIALRLMNRARRQPVRRLYYQFVGFLTWLLHPVFRRRTVQWTSSTSICNNSRRVSKIFLSLLSPTEAVSWLTSFRSFLNFSFARTCISLKAFRSDDITSNDGDNNPGQHFRLLALMNYMPVNSNLVQ